jgi:serine/threonine-protein kinase
MTPSASNESSQDERVNQVIADYLKSVEEGQPLDRQELLARHPDLAAELAAFFADRDRFEQAAAPLRAEAADGEPTLDGTTSAPSGPGTTVRYFGDYELLDEIARGGMGVVYKARQVNLKRIVALKLILAGQLAGPHDVARFHAEAEAAAKLDHPGIVPIFEIGEHEGQHYFSMAFVDGESLAHRIAQGVMEPREAAALMKQVAEAIAYAHVEGVIHRDLKPGNILLQKDEGGRMKDELSPGSSSFIPHPSSFLPRVTDFGLAKRVEGESQGLTATGQVLGTPSYMPP